MPCRPGAEWLANVNQCYDWFQGYGVDEQQFLSSIYGFDNIQSMVESQIPPLSV